MPPPRILILWKIFFRRQKKNEILKISKILRQKNDNQLKNDLVDQILKDNFKDIKIEQCQIPFRAIATDIKNGDEIILKEGSLLGAVRASINLPIVFNPVSLGDKLLIDGSFSNPLPADVVKEMGADFIIAVDVSSKWIDFPLKQTGWWQSVLPCFQRSFSRGIPAGQTSHRKRGPDFAADGIKLWLV